MSMSRTGKKFARKKTIRARTGIRYDCPPFRCTLYATRRAKQVVTIWSTIAGESVSAAGGRKPMKGKRPSDLCPAWAKREIGLATKGHSAAKPQPLPLLHRMEERAGERRCFVHPRRKPPLSSILSPLLRRGERKKKRVRKSQFIAPARKTRAYWNAARVRVRVTRKKLAAWRGPRRPGRACSRAARSLFFGQPPTAARASAASAVLR